MTIFPQGKRRIPILLVAGLLLCGLAYILHPFLPIGGPFGYYDARRDIDKDHISLKLPMLPETWQRGWKAAWRDSVEDKYGIEIGGITPSSFYPGFMRTYISAYNATQMKEILKRYGRDVVEEERERFSSEARLSFQNKK
jgi:hypothetical protein